MLKHSRSLVQLGTNVFDGSQTQFFLDCGFQSHAQSSLKLSRERARTGLASSWVPGVEPLKNRRPKEETSENHQLSPSARWQHGQCMERNVGARPSVRGWRQIVGVGLSCDFEDAKGHLCRRETKADPTLKGRKTHQKRPYFGKEKQVGTNDRRNLLKHCTIQYFFQASPSPLGLHHSLR